MFSIEEYTQKLYVFLVAIPLLQSCAVVTESDLLRFLLSDVVQLVLLTLDSLLLLKSQMENIKSSYFC